MKNDFASFSSKAFEPGIITQTDNADVDVSSIQEQKRERYSQDTRHRRSLTLWAMVIVPVCLLLTMFVVIMCGLGLFHLSDMVLCALLTTTMANILGLAYIILRGMFPHRKG